MMGLKRYVLVVGLALLLLGAAGSAQGLGGGQQAHIGAAGTRGLALEGGRAAIGWRAWATTGRCVTCAQAKASADDGQVDLAVAKTDDPDPVVAGESLTYTLTVTNSGPVTATTVLVTDTLPSGVSFDAARPSQGMYNSVTGVWTVGSLANGGTATLTLAVTVDPSRRGTLTNRAEVSASETDPAPADNTDAEITGVNAEADLVIAKTDGPDPVVAGEPLTYTLTITNSGPSDATGVTVTDTLPSGVSFESARPSQGWYSSVSGVWTVGSVAEGGSATLTLVVTVDPSQRGPLSNSAQASGDETDPTPGNNAATDVETTVDAEADLAVTKTHAPDPVVAGKTLTYTLTVTNSGPSDATGVVVTDTLPLSVTFEAATWSQGAYNSGTGVWTVGSLADGGSATLTLVVTVDPSKQGSLSNSVEVAGTEPDPTPGNNAYEEVTTVRAEADLAIAKADDPDPVVAGNPLTYTLVVTNSGPSDATGVIVTDDLPDQVSLRSATPSQGTCPGSEPVVCNVGPLARGANASVSLVVGVTSPLTNGTSLTNVVTVSGDQTDPYTITNNSAQAWTTVQSSPVLTITKRADPDPVNAGGFLHYTLAITNSGNENATSVIVTEQYDPNVLFLFASPPPDPGSGDRQWTLSTVAVGTPKDIDIYTTVARQLSMGTVLTNQATLGSAQTVPVTVTAVTSTTSRSDLTLSKSDLDDPVDAGAELEYMITYQNTVTGTAPAKDVTITEMYDSQVTFVSAVPPPDVADNVWYIDPLDVGEFGYIRVKVRVDTPLKNGTILTNVVTMVSTDTLPLPLSVTETTTIASAPALTLSVTDDPDLEVIAGDSLTYTLRYSNVGNADATQAVVTATLDTNTTFSYTVPPPDRGSDRVWVWDVGTIAGDDRQGNHGQGEIVIHADVPVSLPDNTFLKFTARLAHAEGDVLTGTAQTTVRSLPDLVIAPVGEGHAPSLFSPNKEMTYTLAYTNTGYGPAQDVIIATALPTGTTYVGHGWQPFRDGTYTYAAGLLPPQSAVHTVTFTVRHADTPEVSAPEFNTPFTIAAHGGAGEDANLDDNTTYVRIGVPDLVVDSLSVKPDAVSVPPNVPVTFTFTITLMNQGTGTAWDPDDEGVFFVEVFTAPVASYPFVRDGEFPAAVGTIAPGHRSPPVVITAPLITPRDRGPVFYIKVDNHGRYPYGLVPEFDEMNNLAVWPPRVFLPTVLKRDIYYEENDHCPSAYGPLDSGTPYSARPDDALDYYYFTLPATATVAVLVEDFAPTRSFGDLLILGPPSANSYCGPIRAHFGQPGHDTSMRLEKSLDPGRYHILVATAMTHYSDQPYILTVTY